MISNEITFNHEVALKLYEQLNKVAKSDPIQLGEPIIYLSPKHWSDMNRELYPFYSESPDLKRKYLVTMFGNPVQIDYSAEGTYVEFY